MHRLIKHITPFKRCLSSYSPKQQPQQTAGIDLTQVDPSQIKPQFTYQPIRPPPQSDSLTFLPPAPFTLSIISMSYNRPTVHRLLSPNFPASKSFRFRDPAGHYVLTAIHQQFYNLDSPIPSHINTTHSCFSKEDQERWKLRRIAKNIAKARHKRAFELRLTFALRIKELHKSAVIRKTMRKRWIAALKLIVQYGAFLPPQAPSNTLDNSLESSNSSRDLIKLNPSDSGYDRWLDKDYYYIVHPNLSLNEVGLVELVGSIRSGLESIKRAIETKNSKTNSPNSLPHDRDENLPTGKKMVDRTRARTPVAVDRRLSNNDAHRTPNFSPRADASSHNTTPPPTLPPKTLLNPPVVSHPAHRPDLRKSTPNNQHLPPKTIPIPKKQ